MNERSHLLSSSTHSEAINDSHEEEHKAKDFQSIIVPESNDPKPVRVDIAS